ncbi:hypothetical protein [Sphingobium sp. CCH11-B1]|uniref:hypothetical protein n=1 Tax=Sphingobium sp. CCH11-B1 TaxID=1768781 RepID=UPI0008324418|nr:hypothetical protein [Sphingobium sp. CCH11-B1]
MNIDVPRSGAAQFTLLLRDVEDGPVDLTGVAVAIEFRNESGDSDTIATAGVEANDDVTGLVWTDQANGQALVTYYGSDFDALDGQYDVVRLSHKIRFTKAGDAPLLVFGRVNLLPE